MARSKKNTAAVQLDAHVEAFKIAANEAINSEIRGDDAENTVTDTVQPEEDTVEFTAETEINTFIDATGPTDAITREEHDEMMDFVNDGLLSPDAEPELSTEEIEDLLQEPAPAVQDEPASNEVDEDAAEELSYDEIHDSFAQDEAIAMTHVIAKAFDARTSFEKDKSLETGKDQIFKTLNGLRGKVVTTAAARVFLACQVDPFDFNRERHSGSRYNVYAIGKIADLVKGLDGGDVSNAINLACMKSLFRFRKAGLTFTMEMAKAACSKQYRPADLAATKHLVRHTVSTSTAPTQASSTMQALETLGVVKAYGSARNPSYQILDTPQTRKLEELMTEEAA